MAQLDVTFTEDYIAIVQDGDEIVGWTEEEWIEDPQVVFSIVHAIILALTNPSELLSKVGR